MESSPTVRADCDPRHKLPSANSNAGGCIVTPPTPGIIHDRPIMPAIIRPSLPVLLDGRFWTVLHANHQAGMATVESEDSFVRTVDFHALRVPIAGGILDQMADPAECYRRSYRIADGTRRMPVQGVLRGNLLTILAITDFVTDFDIAGIIHKKLQRLAKLEVAAKKP